MAQNFDWAIKLGGTSDDEAWSVTADASGNVYTAGTFKVDADFDPGVGTATLTSAGGADIFLSKVNSAGVYQWAVQFGGISSEGSKPTVKTDPSGNVYLAGAFRNLVDFDPGAGTAEITANGTSTDGFVVKLDANGTFQWVKYFTGPDNINVRNLQVDASGNAYVTGDFSGTVDFRPEGTSLEITAQAFNDIYVMKVTTDGTLSWTKVIHTNNISSGYGLALDASANVYASGTFFGTGDFDPGAGSANLTSAGGTDAFVTKWNSAGEYIWAKNFGGSSNAIGQDDDVANAIAVDHNGNVVTTGFFRSTADFDPGVGVFEITSNGVMDIFVSKLDANGNFVWATALPEPGNNVGYDVAVDAVGNIYSTGQFGGQVDFDPGVDFHNLSSSGAEFDIYVSKLKPNGSFASAYRVGSTLRDRGYGIAVDANYNIYTTGYFNGGVDFDPTSGLFNLSSAGLSDAFVLKMSQVVNIPDANFKAALVGNGAINTNMDTEISFNEAATYTGGIDVSGLSITDLTGIEYFVNITELKASNNSLTTADLSNNTQLVTIWIRDNNLGTINLSNIANLDQLFLNGNELAAIDLSDNTLIDELALHDNNLTTIDLSATVVLTEISISDNHLTTINLNDNPLLRKLTINENQLTSLDLSNNPLLINVSAYNNEISSVNLTGLTKVTDLNLTNNQLTSIDLSDMIKLDNLTLVGNELSSIDLTNNGTIRVLNVQSNNLTSLDISPLSNINWLYAQNNDLATITMSSSTAMTILFLGGNQLTSIDLSANTGLTDVRLMNNALTSLDLAPNTLLEKVFINNNSLQSLNIQNGNNAAITIFDATGNSELTCITVDNVAFAEANFTDIDPHTRFSLLCDAVNIPDANFKAALLANASINTTDDGEISFEEAEAFTGTMNVSNESISDLTGIEAFINITALFANNNDLGSIDVSNNIDLQNLQIENCGLSSGIDISALTELTAFNGRSNGFTSIDLSNNTKLSNLRLEFNELPSLDLSSNTMITQLRVANNPLTALDVSAQPNLTTLYADNTQITELDVSGNTSLHTLSLINGELTSLNVANGNNASFVLFMVRFHSDLTCITVDDVAFSESNWSDPDNNANFSTNCSNVETDMLTFSIPEQTSAATIDATAHTIHVEVLYGTDMSNLVPTFSVSAGAIASPASGIAQDFSSGFVYTITAENPNAVQTWNIIVSEENVAPDDIILSNTALEENNAIDQVIGIFSAQDGNLADTHFFTLVAGSGDTDNASFEINEESLIAKESFDFESKANYSIRVKAADTRGGEFEKIFSISITDVVNAPQTISITAIPDKATTADPFEVDATTTSGLPLTYALTGPASISGKTITLDGTEGVITLTVSQAGDDDFASAEAQTTFEVKDLRASQTITFAEIEDQFLEAGSFTLTATASSGLPVTFEVVSGPVTIAGNVVTMINPGDVTIRALQAGNQEFKAAPSVEQTSKIILVTAIPEQKGSSFQFYPNPVSNILTVVPGQPKLQLSIRDLQGRTLTTTSSYSGQPVQLDLSNFPSGMYILRVASESGSTLTKIVKK